MAEERLTWQALTLHLRNPFQVSYGVSQRRTAHWVRLHDDEGWGEGTIPPYYGVEEREMVDLWQATARRTEPFPEEVQAIGGWVGEKGPAPARCALDLALHDRLGRRRGQPVFELLGLPQPPAMATSITIGIDAPEEMARQARALARYPILKLKLGAGDGDEARLAAVREARPDARLYIDANAAWSPQEASARLEKLSSYGLELVEQPVAREDIEGMGKVQASVDVPVVADESVQTLQDVRRLAQARVQAINIKLMKAGGLAPALAMARAAREAGMRIMLGCMIETSLGVTAVAHLAGLADWLDLDAPLLVANDPFEGITYGEDGTVHHPLRAGIGVSRREA
jgi:L-alanine-DL-glutamate epimerase-like enolase superfamily enzyme